MSESILNVNARDAEFAIGFESLAAAITDDRAIPESEFASRCSKTRERPEVSFSRLYTASGELRGFIGDVLVVK